ncbi:MAG: 2-succinyl-6-hydroxy-2,4-cyclohexadiene-1-carboxylate synthase [Myxococcota bacterium]
MSRAESVGVEAAGLRLRATLSGAGPPLLVLHGFTGCADSMEGIATGLSDAYRTLRLDLVGHGGSDAPDSVAAYTMESCVEQVASALDALGVRTAHVIGYSMGGRVALALCAWRPERVRSALLVGASAGLEHPDRRAARRRADEALAARIESEGLERFVDEWMGRPLFAGQRRLGQAALARARAQRLANRPRGLANSLRGMGAGAQPALHPLLERIRTPLRLVAGSQDAKFVAIASDLARRLPNARVRLVPGAGHACHLEAPATFLGIARRFLADVEASRRTPARVASASTVQPEGTP